MKKVGVVTSCISRNAGGLFESVRHLSLSVELGRDFENTVFGPSDEFIETDLQAWHPLAVKVTHPLGPARFGYSSDLVAKLAASNLDLVHSHGLWMYSSFAVVRYCRSRNIPYMVSPHGMLDAWALNQSKLKKRVAAALYEREHLSNAACLRALCRSEALAMRSFGLKNPICVIPNGVSIDGFARETRERPRWARSDDHRKVLLYLGRIHPKKGLSGLIEASSKLRGSNWRLVIAGWDQGNHESELRALVERLGLANYVSFVGPQFGVDKVQSFSFSDAFILPSFSEGLPMVVLEAWSYGLPVLMTPECNLPIGFSSGAAIRLEADVGSIQNALLTLVSASDSDLQKMGHQGYSLVKAEFDWTKIGQTLSSVYHWMVERGPVPHGVEFFD